MSKFMFHIQFSDQGRFLHEHEIYEMMRSRNLYQVQFDLKHRLKKRIRSLELAEKMQIASFQKQRNVFLTKMQEKVIQRNKLAEENPLPLMVNGVKRQIQEKARHVRSVKSLSTPVSRGSETSQHTRSAPSKLVSKELPNDHSVTKQQSSVRLIAKESTLASVKEEENENDESSENSKPVSAKVSLTFRGRRLEGCKSGYRRSKTTFSDEVIYINTSSTLNEKLRHGEQNDERKTPMKSKPELHSRNSTRTLKRSSSKVDIPPSASSGIVKLPENKSSEHYNDNFSDISDDGFRRLAGKYNTAKSLTSLSMPVGTSDMKSLSTYEMGMTTPDGQLILSKDEYDEYLEKFREVKSKRLRLVRRQTEDLEQKVKDFHICKIETV